MGRRGSGYISIDVDTVLDQVDDDHLLDEVAARDLSLPGRNEPTDMDMVREAYDELQRGRPLEARSILDRLLNPKWKTPKACADELGKLFGSH
jgi:hypothetical protein